MLQPDHFVSDPEHDSVAFREDLLRENSITALTMEVLRRLEVAGVDKDERIMIVAAESLAAAYDTGLRHGFDRGLQFEGDVES